MAPCTLRGLGVTFSWSTCASTDIAGASTPTTASSLPTSESWLSVWGGFGPVMRRQSSEIHGPRPRAQEDTIQLDTTEAGLTLVTVL